MKLLICEYVTAGGLGPALGQPLAHEADGMLQALVRDFSVLDGVQVNVLRCPSLPPLAPGVQVEVAAWHADTFRTALARATHALLVAPETGGILQALGAAARSAGVTVLGCTAEAVACCTDKRATATQLLEAGIAHPATFHGPTALQRASAQQPRPHGGWVIKPVDGCGCEQVQLHADLDSAGQAWRALGDASHQQLLQPWLPGQAASLTVFANPQGTRLLSVNLQQLQIGRTGQVGLVAVHTGALTDPDGQLAALAARVVAAIPGLQGIFGIDVVLDDREATVIEVNPRITSAYPGLAATLGCNPAALWLGATPPVPGAATPTVTVTAAGALPREAVTLGWDLGGAHVKVAALAADGTLRDVVQAPCPLWRGLSHLETLLTTLGGHWGAVAQHAVTMSGEMVDLFPDRVTGVQALVDCFARHAGRTPVHVYAGTQGWRTPDLCTGEEAAIASANWLASAEWAAMHLPRGVLVDMGSTTCDLLPFANGVVQPCAIGDQARLASGELVYTGLTRTPLMALLQAVDVAGVRHGVMAEWFASTADIYRVLDCLPEDADQHPTADGAGKTLAESVRRLARMVGCDGPEYALSEWQQVARQFAAAQSQQVAAALARVLARMTGQTSAPGDVVAVLAGVGRQVPAALLQAQGARAVEFGRLGGLLAPTSPLLDAASRAAPAVAVAALLRTRLRAR